MKKRAQSGVLSAVGGWSKALIIMVILLLIIAGAFTLLKSNFSLFNNFRIG